MRYCPRCGKTFYEYLGSKKKKARAFLDWARHVLQGGSYQGFKCSSYPYLEKGSNREWDDTLWQAKRLVYMRDSVISPRSPSELLDNPWYKTPQCQACGFIDEFSPTINSAVNGYSEPFEVQHIRPKSKGGSNHPENLAILCSPCHKKTYSRGYGGIPRIPRSQMKLEGFMSNREVGRGGA